MKFSQKNLDQAQGSIQRAVEASNRGVVCRARVAYFAAKLVHEQAENAAAMRAA